MLRAVYLIPLVLACGTAAPKATPAAGMEPAASRAPQPGTTETTPNAVAAASAARPAARPAPKTGRSQDRDQRRAELKAKAGELLRTGDYDGLRVVTAQLEELEIEPLINAARRGLREDDPQGALLTIEQALARAPQGPTARLVHADASYQVGLNPHDPERLQAAIDSYLIASESPPRWLERDARREFRARALLGASRAATTLGKLDQALVNARLCLELVEEVGPGGGVRNRLNEWPEKRLFDAAFDVYVSVRDTDPIQAQALAVEMEAALRRPLARNSNAIWPWTSLASLYLGEQRFDEARETALEGLERHPADLTLPGQLTEAARGLGGSDEVHAALALLKERAPSAALPWWYTARERFDAAVQNLGETPVEEFQTAEADFRRCRDLQPEYGPECLYHEALCRSSVGWTLLGRGELDEARKAFLSMEALVEDGLRSELRGAIPSGIDGLDRVGREHFERDELVEAASVYRQLHEYEPTRVDWALKTGQYHRDAGARMEVQAEAARRLSANPERDRPRAARLVRSAGIPAPQPGSGDAAAWQAALARVDVTLKKNAEKMFATSYSAYRAAVELEPDNVRLLVNAAMLPVHHLGEDLEWAETALMRCVDLGREQLATGGRSEEQRLALTQAWGDAHQNLGVLAFDHKNDLEAAQRWFEQSLAIGPYPRPIVEQDYLPRCAASGSARNP